MSAGPASADQAVLAPPIPKPESAVIVVAPVNDAAHVIPVAPAVFGLSVVAEARWPESEHDHTPPMLPGFIVSSFSPIAAETAARCLRRRPIGAAGTPATGIEAIAAADPSAAAATHTAVIIATPRGDLQSATHVAEAVDTAAALGPLLFFQSVPNAVAGHIAARWNLTGPVVCLADRPSALEAAALLIADGDADEALVIHIEQAAGTRAHAVLLRSTAPGPAPGPGPAPEPAPAPGPAPGDRP
ncbi:MAG: hypothetical protein ACJ786_41285 [Catenulispora sp.]